MAILGNATPVTRPSASQHLPKLPHVITSSYILKKHAGKPPSITIHLYQRNFRFDGQDGSFSYVSHMRPFLECLKTEIIPAEILQEFQEADTVFYDGRLIVQVHDHRAASPTTLNPSSIKAVYPSIHDYNEWITPSPLAPYPPQKILRQAHDNVEDARNGKEGQKKTKVYTIVLHPTPMTFFEDMATVASMPIPTTSAPRYLDDVSSQQFEAKHLLATAPSLILNPTTSLLQARKIARVLKDPAHSFPFPPPKSRKRNVAELRADEVATAHEERFLLLGDERRYTARASRKSPHSAVDDGVGASAEQRFQKFKAIEQIQLHRKERERWLGQRNEMRQRQMIEARRRGAEMRKRPATARSTRQQGNHMSVYNSLAPDPQPNDIPTASQFNGVSATTHPGAFDSSSRTSGQRRGPLSDQQHVQMLAAQHQQALLQLMRQRGESSQLNQPPRPQQQQQDQNAAQQGNDSSFFSQQSHSSLTKEFKVDSQLPSRQSQADIAQAAQVGHRVQQPRSSNSRPISNHRHNR